MPVGPADMIWVMASIAWLTFARFCIAPEPMICVPATAAPNAPPLCVIGPIVPA